MSKSRGFTLIELLITISIIAILAAIGLMAFSTALKQGRNSKRQSDIRSIQSALEQYFADQFYYPLYNVSSCSNGRVAFNASSPCKLTDPSNTKTYMNSVPIDPLSSNPQYLYVPFNYSTGAGCDNVSNICNGYCLYANLENASGISNPPDCSAPLPNGYNFAVTTP